MTRDDITDLELLKYSHAYDTSGQAFPAGDPTHGGHQGMTLRDYFAAKAMQAILTRPDCTVTDIEAVARGAYEVAKVMLETRENKT